MQVAKTFGKANDCAKLATPTFKNNLDSPIPYLVFKYL